MGIKFYCPNGHKLNVKAFLAGKRGICPHCGCKMDIPLESQRGRDAKNKPSTDAAESMPMATTANSPAESSGAATATAAVASAPVASAPVASAPVASAPVASEPVASAPAASAPVANAPVSQAAVTATVAAAPSDPLADAPDALWYVRPTTGGQYGPASPEAMRGWIGEGRVNGQSLVWREGWPEWKKAEGIFKQLTQPTTPTTPPVAAAPAMSVPSAASATVPSRTATPPAPTVAPTSTPTSSVSQANEPRSNARRRKSNIPTIVAVVVMTLLLIVSVFVLVNVWR
ncbi:MAG: DUF4339 domain-containing protein [Planctomycetes bacterium]|nr:DUF4339 domain-containing protein [Planctomycetota bacterium]